MHRLCVALALSATLLAPTVHAHAAPDPPEYMVRLLHDYNDDWGQDASQTSTRDGHDLIALDLREEYNRTLGENALVFRFTMNFGYDADSTKPELKEVLSFKAKGQTVTRELKTPDNTKFSGSFDAVYGPQPMRKSDGSVDGKRFYVEGLIKFSSLGVKAGDKVSDFFVQGYGGTQAADHMVGGFTIGGQRNDSEPPSEQSQSVSYRRNEYTLRGPVMYGKSSVDPTAVAAKQGDNRTITWTIVNNLGRTQTFTASADPPAGVTVALHGREYAKDALTFQIAAGLSTAIHVYVTPGEDAESGPIRLALETSLGGRYEHAVDLTIGTAVPSNTAAGSATDTGGDSPMPAFVVIAGMLIAAAIRVRRR